MELISHKSASRGLQAQEQQSHVLLLLLLLLQLADSVVLLKEEMASSFQVAAQTIKCWLEERQEARLEEKKPRRSSLMVRTRPCIVVATLMHSGSFLVLAASGLERLNKAGLILPSKYAMSPSPFSRTMPAAYIPALALACSSNHDVGIADLCCPGLAEARRGSSPLPSLESFEGDTYKDTHPYNLLHSQARLGL